MTKFAFTGCLLFCLALALLGCPDDKTAEEACKNLKDVCPLGTKFELSASSVDTCNADLSEGNLSEGAGLTISGSCDSIGSCVYACTHEPCCKPSHEKTTQPDGTVTETYECEIPPNADGECVNAGDLCDPPCGPGAECTTNGECHCGEAGASCDDGDKCTDGDSCSEDGSSCEPGPAKDCSDGDVCTGNETCEPDTGNCTAGPPPQCGNYACDITSGCKDSCTLETWAADCAANYGCSDGQCVSNTAENGEDCSSDNACKSVHCQNGFCCDNDKCCNNTGDCGENEQCTGENLCTCELGTECSDGNACTVNDTCVDAGKVNLCQGTDNTSSCDDGNGCTTDTCDIASGECVSQNNALACNDGNKCTTGDTCASGSCAVSTPVECEGGEKCDSNKGCGQGCSSELDCKDTHGCDTVTGSCVKESLSNGSPCAGNKACASALCNSQGLCCTSGEVCCNTDDMPCVPPANKCSGDQLKTLSCGEQNICIEDYNLCSDNFSCDSSSGCLDECTQAEDCAAGYGCSLSKKSCVNDLGAGAMCDAADGKNPCQDDLNCNEGFCCSGNGECCYENKDCSAYKLSTAALCSSGKGGLTSSVTITKDKASAQAFSVKDSGEKLVSVTVYLKYKSGGASTNFSGGTTKNVGVAVAVYSDSGSSPGTSNTNLKEVSYGVISSSETSYKSKSFEFKKGISLSPSSKYWVAVYSGLTPSSGGIAPKGAGTGEVYLQRTTASACSTSGISCDTLAGSKQSATFSGGEPKFAYSCSTLFKGDNKITVKSSPKKCTDNKCL